MTTNSKEISDSLTLSPEAKKAIEVIEAEQKVRVAACLKDIQDVLNRHRCDIVTETVIRGSQVISGVMVVPKQ